MPGSTPFIPANSALILSAAEEDERIFSESPAGRRFAYFSAKASNLSAEYFSKLLPTCRTSLLTAEKLK